MQVNNTNNTKGKIKLRLMNNWVLQRATRNKKGTFDMPKVLYPCTFLLLTLTIVYIINLCIEFYDIIQSFTAVITKLIDKYKFSMKMFIYF